MSGVECPKCHAADSGVSDSRPIAGAVRRRRTCDSCGFRFTTYERASPRPGNAIDAIDLTGKSARTRAMLRHLARILE